MLRRAYRRPAWALIAAALFAAIAGPAVAGEIRVGLAAPLTGRMAAVGLAMRDALANAVRDANAAGGLLGEQLSLQAADDGCSGAVAEGAASTLIAAKVAVVIGHPCSGAATAATPVYAAQSVLFIAVGARHPEVMASNRSHLILRLAGRDDRQGAAAARWLAAHAPGGKVAIVHDPTLYARGVAEAAQLALASAGTGTIEMIPIAARRAAYDGAVERIRASGAEAVLFAGFADEGAIVLSGLAAAEHPIAFLGTDALAAPPFAAAVAKANGPVAVLLPAEPGASRMPGDPIGAGQRARGAFEAWIATARKIGRVDGESVAGAVKGARVTTETLGVLRFGSNGDLVTEDFAPALLRDGEWVREDVPTGQ